MVRYSEGFYLSAKTQISAFIEDFMVTDGEGLTLPDGKKRLETELGAFPLLMMVKDLVDGLKMRFEANFEKINKRFVGYDVRTIGSAGWRSIDDYLAALSEYYAVDYEAEDMGCCYLQPIRPVFNFLLEVDDGKLDFIGCLQVIKIEKQLEKILRLYKVGKVIPKLFDKVVH